MSHPRADHDDRLRARFPSRPRRTGWALLIALVLASRAGMPCGAQTADGSGTLAGYLTAFGVDRAARSFLEEPLAWDEAKQRLALRVVARLQLAPAERLVAWESESVAFGADTADLLGDRFVRVAGRALFVAPADLPADDPVAVAMPRADLVRVQTADGRVVDTLASAVPRAWPRWRAIDEPASVVGLPLALDAGPSPRREGDGVDWPPAPPAVVLAAGRVAWHPDTPLGARGMDYGLFDTVADGRPLTAADGDAFYATLAAAGRGPIEPPASSPPITDLIDPAQRWFGRHRGDVVALAGICRRATRIEIDDPLRVGQAGIDHYWELFVFVETPLLQIHDRVHDTYPVVCCVRDLPAGMPTGQALNERVRVSGFGFKRYAYPLPHGADGGGTPQRLEVPLIVAHGVRWRPSTPGGGNRAGPTTGLLLAGLGAGAAALAAWWWWCGRGRPPVGDRPRLPDRVRLPGDGAGS